MTLEARIGFIIILLLTWAVIGVFPWTVAAIRMKGRGALHLLPLVVLSSILAGIIIPLTGARGLTGLAMSMPAALVGAVVAAAAGAAFVPRLLPDDGSPRTPRPRRGRSDAHTDDS